MKLCLSVVLLLLVGLVQPGSGLSCYKCESYSGLCENVEDCTTQDACLSLSEQEGKTVRRCIRYTDCNNARLSLMFPSMKAFTYRCCTNNLCNSAGASTKATPAVALAAALLAIWWCWL